jgi:hypothetical protein
MGAVGGPRSLGNQAALRNHVGPCASIKPGGEPKMSGGEAVANARRIAIVTATKMVVGASVFLVEQALAAV